MTASLDAGIPPDANLADGVLGHARRAPDRPALALGDRTLTYRDIGRRIEAFAAAAHRRGLAPGDRVAVVSNDWEASLVAWFGAARAGLVAVPLPVDLPEAERSALAVDIAIVGTLHTIDIMQLAEEGMGAAPAAVRFAGGDAPAVVLTSSGTTGRPKAIALSHHHQLRVMRLAAAAMGVDATDRCFPVIAPSFAMGRNPPMRTLDAGGTVVALALPDNVEDFVDLMRREAITDLSMTPTHLRLLLDQWRHDRLALPGLRRLASSSAALHHAQRLETMGRINPALHVGLGTTETGYVTLAGPADMRRVPDTVGKALPGMVVDVVDPEGRTLPPGEIGELRIAGPGIAAEGYLNAPEATARAFRDGRFLPGDLATLTEDGDLCLLGRVDDRINRGGVKIYPIEIERALRAHPNVADAAVVGLPAVRTGETPIAAVVLSAPVPTAELQRWVRKRIGADKVPDRIAVVTELPRNAMNKVPSAALRELVIRALDLPRAPRRR